MADLQQALLSKIIRDGELSTVVNAKITADFFTDDQWHRVYTYLLKHWRRYGTSPTLESVHHDFPSYDWPVFDQDIDYYIHGLRQRRKRAILTEGLERRCRLLPRR